MWRSCHRAGESRTYSSKPWVAGLVGVQVGTHPPRLSAPWKRADPVPARAHACGGAGRRGKAGGGTGGLGLRRKTREGKRTQQAQQLSEVSGAGPDCGALAARQ